MTFIIPSSGNQWRPLQLHNTVHATYNMSAWIVVDYIENQCKLILRLIQSNILRIGECSSNSPFLKNNGAEAHCFKEWRDTRTFSNLKSTHCTLLILLIINLVTRKSLCIVSKVQSIKLFDPCGTLKVQREQLHSIIFKIDLHHRWILKNVNVKPTKN